MYRPPSTPDRALLRASIVWLCLGGLMACPTALFAQTPDAPEEITAPRGSDAEPAPGSTPTEREPPAKEEATAPSEAKGGTAEEERDGGESSADEEAAEGTAGPASDDAEAGEAEGEREEEEDAGFQRFVERQAALELQVGLRLYRAYDDYRAITSLRRYQIMADSARASFLTHLMIGQIYHRNDKPSLAALEFERGIEHAPGARAQTWLYLLGLQEVCLPLSFYFECRNRLEQLAENDLPSDLEDLVTYQTLYTDIVLRSEHVGPERVEAIEDPKLRDKALGLVERDRAFEELDLQSPWAAGILSGVLPGAGQVYNGKWVDGLIAFSFNALFGATTYYAFAQAQNIPLGIVSGVFALGFYIGNIVNAVTDANRMNAKTYLSFFDELKEDYWPRATFSIQANRVQFTYRFDWPGPRPTDPPREGEFEDEKNAPSEGDGGGESEGDGDEPDQMM